MAWRDASADTIPEKQGGGALRTVQEDTGARGMCEFLPKTVHSSPLGISVFEKRHRATRVFQVHRDETELRLSLLGFFLDGAHGRDDGGLGAAGRGGHRHHRGKGRTGGDDGGLGHGHWDGRVPFAFPLLGLG